jgi:Holliday junction resolvase RusA-like endonuclease
MRYPDQPKHTCPDIDAFKKKIATYLRDYPDDIKGNLETIHDFCEDMRYKNSGAMQAFSSEYQFTLRTRRRKDTGNYWSMIQKCFFDYLSEAGYIADDSNVQHKKETMTQTVYDKSAKFDFVTVTIREEER